MNKNFSITLFLLFVATFLNAQQRFSAKIDQATVYLRGAALTHTTTASLPSGSYDILIDGISPNIEVSSLKVKANGVLISAVEFSNDFITPREESAKIKKLEDSLEMYKQQYQDVSNDLVVQKHLLKLITDATSNNMATTENIVSIADINANMELYKTKAAPIQKNIDADNKKIAKLNETIERLNQQIKQDAVRNKQKTGLVRLAVSVPEKINTKFTITYFTNTASWTPCYDINIPSMEKNINLQAKAQVRQTTGLDWNNVNLTLSNATPNRGGEAPILSTWFLNFMRTGAGYFSARSNAVVMNKATAVAETADANVAKDEDLSIDYAAPIFMDDYVEVDEQEVHVNYAISVPYDIPGNGKSQLIDLKNYQIKSDYYYYSVPKMVEETYLLAVLSDYENLNLLPGMATISYNNTFVGRTYIQPNTSEKEFRLTLTTEPRISVKREKRSDFCSTKHIGNTTTVTQSYLITVKNNQNKAINLTLKDQYPISSNKDIDVKVIEITPGAKINNSETGIVTWETSLNAGETKTFVITYSVKYPKEKNVAL